VLNGHSTGGLSSSLYAATGTYREHIKALVLNSPFFRFNLAAVPAAIMSILAWMSPVFPFIGLEGKTPLPYIESIHKAHQGEWEFSLDWRKIHRFSNLFRLGSGYSKSS
jgi:alpha-beta hydrolase superfamily lysophospholipase